MSTLFLVGDSTVAYYDLTIEDTDFLYPRNGYGMWLSRYLKGSIFVRNLALSGRSTKSFLKEDYYEVLKNNIKKGDFLMIGFGHNDEKFKDNTRFTFGEGDVTDPKSFKYYLYNYYIKLAQNVGATPILCTPIVRRSPENIYEGDRIHRILEVECDGEKFPPSDYSRAVRELGSELGITVIDMTEITKNYYLGLSESETANLHATTSMNIADVDNTHLNSYGAMVLSRLFCENLKKTDCPLKNYLLDEFYTPCLDDRIENK